MTQPNQRRFTLADGMIAVAAAAGGAALLRSWYSRYTPLAEPWYGTTTLVECASWLLLPLTLGWLALRLRRPRPSFRRLCRQPGV